MLGRSEDWLQSLPEVSRGTESDLDISGYPKEGAREGDLDGAITLTALLD